MIEFTKRFRERFDLSAANAVEEIYSKYFTGLIDEKVRVSYTSSNVWGKADIESNTILLKRITRHTIAHELMHLAQYNQRNGIPQGERACDVYTCALGPDVIDNVFYILTHRAPAEIIHESCREAIGKRREGMRNYIQYAENRMRESMRARSASERIFGSFMLQNLK